MSASLPAPPAHRSALAAASTTDSLTALALIAALIVPSPAHHRPPPMQPALASWFDDAGQTASGRHYPLGFASLILGSRWGERVRFCYRRRCATGQLEDHGPYVSGRTFDLNPTLRDALGCPDLCSLRWKVARDGWEAVSGRNPAGHVLALERGRIV